MICYRGIGVSLRSYQDASSEGGVTSVITPLSIRRGAGGEAFCWVLDDGCWVLIGT